MPAEVAPKTFDVPGLGIVIRDERFGWYGSAPIGVPILGDKCRLLLEGYAEDDRKPEFHAAIANFLRLDPQVLRHADEPLFRYYKDLEAWWLERGQAPLRNAKDAWGRVEFGHEAAVMRRPHGNRAIYVSVECECAWDEEHGLQLVFENGLRINKLGPYDGHVTNSDAYANPRLEDVIYYSLA